MELRFFMGYVIGAILLAVLYHYDFEWWVAITIGVVVYVGTRTIVHQLFDK